MRPKIDDGTNFVTKEPSSKYGDDSRCPVHAVVGRLTAW
jgi:hypothetical protein